MKKILLTLLLAPLTLFGQNVLISGYVETNSGTQPKGIEIWNPSGQDIDLSVTPITIDPSNSAAITINSGILEAGAVLVVGNGMTNDTDSCGNTLSSQQGSFVFNGDDYIDVSLDGVLQDRFGDTTDPGSAWTGGGVSTRNSSIQLVSGITTGDTDGWTDPSTRFEEVSTTPASDSELEGFGIPPGGCPTPLPVELASISAEWLDAEKVASVEWTTLSEIENERFEVEHSVDGLNWSTAGNVAGNGTTDVAHDYSFLHTKAVNGVNYYRVKQVDFDGSFSFSEIVSVNALGMEGLQIISANRQTLNVTTNLEGSATYEVFNSMGRLVTAADFNAVKGNQAVYFNQELAHGFYIIRLTVEGESKTVKFVIH